MKGRILISSLFLGILSHSGAVFASDHRTRAPARNGTDPSTESAEVKDSGPCHHVLTIGGGSTLNGGMKRGSSQTPSRLARP